MDPLPEGGSFCYNAHGKERKKGRKVWHGEFWHILKKMWYLQSA